MAPHPPPLPFRGSSSALEMSEIWTRGSPLNAGWDCQIIFEESSLVVRSKVLWPRIRPPPLPPAEAAKVDSFEVNEI